MELSPEIEALASRYRVTQRGKASRHAPDDRLVPPVWQYDHLVLAALAADVHALIQASGPGRDAIDIGCGQSPYRKVVEAQGYTLRTLDVDASSGADLVGTAEATTLPDASVDLILCTQVLEHCSDPWGAAREMTRVLRPGGHAVVTVPHVWFYHPHPQDNWRFTQEGVVRLMSEAGLTVTALRAQGGSVLALGQIVNFLAYGVIGRAGAPLYASVNIAAAVLDRVVANPLFSLNFACLVRRP